MAYNADLVDMRKPKSNIKSHLKDAYSKAKIQGVLVH